MDAQTLLSEILHALKHNETLTITIKRTTMPRRPDRKSSPQRPRTPATDRPRDRTEARRLLEEAGVSPNQAPLLADQIDPETLERLLTYVRGANGAIRDKGAYIANAIRRHWTKFPATSPPTEHNTRPRAIDQNPQHR